MATKTKPVDYPAILQKWQTDVQEVMTQIQTWLLSLPEKPEVKDGKVTIHERNFPEYTAPCLNAWFTNEYPDYIEVRTGARNYPNRGDIMITSKSNLRRVYLLQNESNNGWTIYTDSNMPIHLDLNEKDFHTLINELRAEI